MEGGVVRLGGVWVGCHFESGVYGIMGWRDECVYKKSIFLLVAVCSGGDYLRRLVCHVFGFGLRLTLK
jgi:hypothetical protein